MQNLLQYLQQHIIDKRIFIKQFENAGCKQLNRLFPHMHRGRYVVCSVWQGGKRYDFKLIPNNIIKKPISNDYITTYDTGYMKTKHYKCRITRETIRVESSVCVVWLFKLKSVTGWHITDTCMLKALQAQYSFYILCENILIYYRWFRLYPQYMRAFTYEYFNHLST